jgi:uncharacterized protein YndB with AHSA1/START domain
MIANKETIYTKDLANKKMKVVRDFDAPLPQVWKAWTEPAILDRWWAPKPWKANTQSMDFRPGGVWLYTMEGPKGEKQYCRADYQTIVPNKMFTGKDAFCDENGKIKTDMFRTNWKTEFTSIANGTRVIVEITADTEMDLQKMVEMGFEEGFAMAHRNLDEIFEKQTA